MAQGKQTVKDKEIIQFMEESDDPAFTTNELAEAYDMSTEGMRGRLKQLLESGEIECKKPGKRSMIWWAKSDQSAPLCSQK